MEPQLRAMLRASAARAARRPRAKRVAELLLPLLLAPPLAGVRLLGGAGVEVPEKSGVDRAVHLHDPFATKYAARLCGGESGGLFGMAPAPMGLGADFRTFLRRRFGRRPRGWPRFVDFNDSKSVERYLDLETYGEGPAPLCGAIIFDSSAGFTVRLNGTVAGNRGAVCGGIDTRRIITGRNIDKKLTSGDWYLCSGFLALQRLATEFLLEVGGHPVPQLDLDAVPFPTAAYQSRAVLSAAPDLLALSAMLIFAYRAAQVAGQVVAERESKLLEAMKLLGLRDSVRFAAHVINFMPLFALYGLEFAVTLHLGVFMQSSLAALTVFLALAGLSFAAMALSLSSLFDSARAASLACVVGLLGASRLATGAQAALLLPPVALAQGMARIVELELADVGLQLSNMLSAEAAGDSAAMSEVVLLLAFDVVLFLLLWVYLDRVIPHAYGAAAYPWYRPWARASRAAGSGGDGSPSASPTRLSTRRRVPQGATGIVEDSLPLACAVELSQVRKEYLCDGRRLVVAVRRLDLGLPEGEILALLGHNGAGKSTTVSMLTGAERPTEGKITVYGADVTTHSSEARRHLGVCPQHDVLFDDLTAAEHLRLAAALRGCRGGSGSAAGLLKDVALSGALATGTPAGSLSAGRRRALNVALAFVGEPRFIVLDEPTSGMDPFVRRTMWDLLKKHRANRAICLSTHYMEEAEMLGDQVCILSRGSLQCYGSPDWLKVRLGSGYSLTLTRSEESNASTAAEACAEAALQVIQKAAPRELRAEIAIASAEGRHVVLRLPFRLSSDFPHLLRTLEGQKVRLGYSSLSVSATTLEDLFVRLADGDGTEALAAGAAAAATAGGTAVHAGLSTPTRRHAAMPRAGAGSVASLGMTMRDAVGMEALIGELAELPQPRSAGPVRQGTALLIKRFQACRRNKRSIFCLCLLPVLFNVLGLASIITTFELDSPPLELLATASALSGETPRRGVHGAGSAPLAAHLAVPYTTGSTWVAGWQLRRQADRLMDEGVKAGLWDAPEYLNMNTSLRRGSSRRSLKEVVKFKAFFDGDDNSEEGGADMSKYEEMRQKGAPEFVIKKVMEKDGVSPPSAERFLRGGGGGGGGGGGDRSPGAALRGRVAAGANSYEVSLDFVRKEVGVELGGGTAGVHVDRARRVGTLFFQRGPGRAELDLGVPGVRVDVRRPELLRDELAHCAAGGPAAAAAAEEAAKGLDEATREALQAMQAGGAPAFAQRAFLEQAGVAPAAVEALVGGASAEVVPEESRGRLERCARWQAFAAALLAAAAAPVPAPSLAAAAAGLPHYGAYSLDALGSGGSGQVAVFYNDSVLHAAPLFVALLQRAAAGSAAVGSAGEVPEIQVTNWPLPLTKRQRSRAFSTQGFSFFTMALIGAAFLPAGLVGDLSRELTSGVVRQQKIAGMPTGAFIISSFLADVVLVLPPLLSQLWFISTFQLAVFVDCLPVVALLLVGFALASTAQVYALLAIYKDPAGDQNAILALNVVTGFILALITWILGIPFLGSTANILARCLTVVGRVSPAYNLANAMLTIPNTALPGFSDVHGLGVLHRRVAGEPLLALALNFALFLAVALRAGTGPEAQFDGSAGRMRRSRSGSEEAETDEPAEVLAERRAAEAAAERPGEEAGLVILKLAVTFAGPSRRMPAALLKRTCRWFGCCRRAPRRRIVGSEPGASEHAPRDVAVGPLTLVAPSSSALALLGVSGSGKSVALAALAGALPPEATVRGEVLLRARRLLGARTRPGDVGYCPQDNVFSHGLTVVESVRLFGRIRGLRGRALAEDVAQLVRGLDLEAFECARGENLSGGNQRKMVVACALVGSPKLVCLDEPSSGLDPVARRALWSTVQARLRATGATAIVATKTTEEAEALCSRLAILSREGRLSTVGTAQETRARYGGGHELRAKLRRPTSAEVFQTVGALRDVQAMARLLASASSALAGADAGEGEEAAPAPDVAAARRLVDALPETEPSAGGRSVATAWAASYGRFLGELRRAGHEVGPDAELLPEDAPEMRAELDLRGQRILSELRLLFPGARCVEAVSLTCAYQLNDVRRSSRSSPPASVGQQHTWSVGDLFRIIEERKDKFKIVDYAITQASLEHVFNQFATQDQDAGTDASA